MPAFYICVLFGLFEACLFGVWLYLYSGGKKKLAFLVVAAKAVTYFFGIKALLKINFLKMFSCIFGFIAAYFLVIALIFVLNRFLKKRK